MQSVAALASGLAILAFSGWVALRVNGRLINIPIMFRVFVGLIIFVTVSWPLAFLAQLILYGHL